MSVTVIQDYGTTVSPELYMSTLQGHQYIPQADQCIKNIIKKFCNEKPSGYRSTILDVGCGPGRLTANLGNPNSYKIGLDISQRFIEYAQKVTTDNNHGVDPFLSFQCDDFATGREIFAHNGKTISEVDTILMQGVMHHIHGEDRNRFLEKCYALLEPDGILIIGDEFIKDYENEERRIINVAKFYLHVIGEAKKGGFDELAEEEAKNLIDDCFSGTRYAGLVTNNTLECIYRIALSINTLFYNYGSVAGLNFEADNQIRNMFDCIKKSVQELAEKNVTSASRGDYKTSINKFTEEINAYGFMTKEFVRKIGPVDELGGMAVLTFEKV